MRRVILDQPDSFDAFRVAARNLAANDISPDAVTWQVGSEGELFGGEPPPAGATPLSIPKAYLPLAETVICHSDPQRFALLYEMLWRIVHGERALLAVAADPLVHRLRQMEKAVGRDLHKMTAFVRFRRVDDETGEHYIAWFEPEHHILRRVSSFFVDRFSSMRWAIWTPQGSLVWDGKALAFGPPIPKEMAPQDDDLEGWWKSYYRSIFNPARANPDAMRAEMPKKYWKNLPEASLIPDLLSKAGQRTETMIASPAPAPRASRAWVKEAAPEPAVGSLPALKAQAKVCQRCPLYGPATQTVFGEGPTDAPVVFVGEQPGDQEDLAGVPFVGPAGQMFDRAMAEAGVDRARVYVTNAVKHFKYEPRGKRRIHSRPNSSEIEHCRWWVDKEIDLIRPDLVVAMGATAARSLTGRTVTISRERGRLTDLGVGRRGFITVHPSFLLRLPDAAAQATEYARFVEDLRRIGDALPAVRLAA